MKNLLYTILIACSALSLSCQKVLIKPDPASEPERNFEIFWNDVNNGYPYFEEDGIDWKERYNKYRPLVTSGTSTRQLFDYMSEMLSGFSDGHLSVQYNGNYHSNEKTIPSIIDLVKTTPNGGRVTSAEPILFYLQNHLGITRGYMDPSSYTIITASNGLASASVDTVCIYGYISSESIIYINITSFLTRYSFDNLIRSIVNQYPASKGMVLDLRFNEGGNLATMFNAVSVFIPAGSGQVRYAYAKEKVGPLPQNFGEEQYYFVQSSSFPAAYTKPVVVLVNRLSVSSAEHAALAMREIRRFNPKIAIAGDYTFGATSFVVERTLPNGIQYTLVNSKTFDLNRNVIEKTGVRPDHVVYTVQNDMYNNKDNQLEFAISKIKSW